MKILITINTHGDEINGFTIPEGVDSLIANPRAKEEGKRYIESDLNRSFNGKSDTFEEKMAQELIPILQNYDFVIDIHSTITGNTDAVISTHNTAKEQEAAHYAHAGNYIYIPTLQNSLIHHAINGLALELGLKTEKERYQKAINNLVSFLQGKKSQKTTNQKRWKCLGTEEKPEGYTTHLKNYENVSKGQIIASKPHHVRVASENFTTFLWGSTQYEDIFGFKLVKL